MALCLSHDPDEALRHSIKANEWFQQRHRRRRIFQILELYPSRRLNGIQKARSSSLLGSTSLNVEEKPLFPLWDNGFLVSAKSFPTKLWRSWQGVAAELFWNRTEPDSDPEYGCVVQTQVEWAT
jgi:hypothetical protein